MYLVPPLRPLWSILTASRSSQLGFSIRLNFIVALFFLGTSVIGSTWALAEPIGTSVNGVTSALAEPIGFIRERLVGDAYCAVPAQTQAGLLCGTRRATYLDRPYDSFRGVPYARQPLGALRFAAPQAVDPWDGFFNASVEGPICPQHDVLYGPMQQPRSMGEDCLHANVHVPTLSLLRLGTECGGSFRCLPVVVFLHGGAFHSGSGDSDIYGPEYMMDRDAILITLNYRVGPFGFLSLNSSSVPGNTGLRDIIAALQWVQTNARAFGGDPGRVTLMGHSSGASDAHILSLSPAASGLFRNVILMSGTATSGFFSTLPSYAQYIKNAFLNQLGINRTDPGEILSQLNALPYQALVDANYALLQSTGFTVFCPVVESQFDGVTRILDDDPEVLITNGRGNNYPMLVGFTNNECASLQRTLEKMDIVEKIKKNSTVILPARLLYSASPEKQAADAKQMMDNYFSRTMSLDSYIPACSDALFVYPVLKLAEARLITGGAPCYLYQFTYGSPSVPSKLAYGIQYTGAGHMDDLSYVLRVNSILNNTLLNGADEDIKVTMLDIIDNFIVCTEATCLGQDDYVLWPSVSRENGFQYRNILGLRRVVSRLTSLLRYVLSFFDSLYGVKSNSNLYT